VSDAGASLIQFFEDEIINKPDVVLSMIASKIGKSQRRIAARNCSLEVLQWKEAAAFLEIHHLAGSGVKTARCYSLKHRGEIVAVMTIGRRGGSSEMEILRLAFSKNTIVMGGLARLVAHLGPETIYTFCDRRFSSGKGWKTVGFSAVNETPPGYFYVKNGKRFSRNTFQKHKLHKYFGTSFDATKSERDNMFVNGYDRIWDCGHLKLRLN